MMKAKKQTTIHAAQSKTPRGIAINSVIIPAAVMLMIMHTVIILSIIHINISSSELSSIMQDYNTCISEATSLLAGSSLLSEISSGYVLMPFDETGRQNVGALVAYAGELQTPRRGHDVLSRFAEYDVGEEAIGLLTAAAESADRMNEAQYHAIELMRSVYSLPDIPELDGLPRYELPEEEKALTEEEKLDLAVRLVFGSAYSSDKAAVSRNVNACVALFQQEMQAQSTVASEKIALGRKVLWGMTLSIVGTLILVFALFYSLLVSPLNGFAKRIDSDEALEEERGMREIRILANSYNALRQRRILTEQFLRSAASTDALTGMSNRLSFNHYMLDQANTDGPMAVVLFDVNYLKITNDTCGHLAGDELICDAAACISSCFDPEHKNSCFRIGGDEFAACLIGEDEETLAPMLERFKEDQISQGISVAYGYACRKEGDEVSFEALFNQADKAMYERKAKMHAAQTGGGDGFL